MSKAMRLRDRALRMITEGEIRRAMRTANHDVIEWEAAGFTFLRDERTRVIIRAGSLGGDVRDIHGGWKYLTVADMDHDWNEIRDLAESFKRHGIT